MKKLDARLIIRKSNSELVGVLGQSITNLQQYPVEREIFSYAEKVRDDLNKVFQNNQVALIASIEEY